MARSFYANREWIRKKIEAFLIKLNLGLVCNKSKAAALISRFAHYIFPFINQTNMPSMLVSPFNSFNHQLLGFSRTFNILGKLCAHCVLIQTPVFDNIISFSASFTLILVFSFVFPSMCTVYVFTNLATLLSSLPKTNSVLVACHKRQPLIGYIYSVQSFFSNFSALWPQPSPFPIRHNYFFMFDIFERWIYHGHPFGGNSCYFFFRSAHTRTHAHRLGCGASNQNPNDKYNANKLCKSIIFYDYYYG